MGLFPRVPWQQGLYIVPSSSVVLSPTACSLIVSAPCHHNSHPESHQILQIGVFVLSVKNPPLSNK